MDREFIMAVIEAIAFSSGEPVSIEEISNALGISQEEIINAIENLKMEYKKISRGIFLSIIGGKIRLTTKPEVFPYLEKLFKQKTKVKLKRAALETLAIIMFKQPITKTEIEMIRGVNVEKTLNSLIEKGLIKEVDRLDAPGKPILYGTTDYCLEYFGLESIEKLKDEYENRKNAETN
ncbi:SMC-Scp complex subunit ScpB [Thermovenabulum sp.]|uniref:SMC-Scp complex subunit ScpB n=1 Tax=Thermovenabulum sp. TaxID=3100335 RepID=UPI003C7D3D34